MVVVVTGGEQSDNKGIGDAVKREIAALVKRNWDEPVQRLAEVTAIKEVNRIPRCDYYEDHNNHMNFND